MGFANSACQCVTVGIVTALAVASASGCNSKGAGRVDTTNGAAASLASLELTEATPIDVCSADPARFETLDPRKRVRVVFEVKDPKVAKAAESELFVALTAVPKEALDAFDLSSGRVLVTDHAAHYCSFRGVMKSGEKAPVFQSCLVFIPFGAGKTKDAAGVEGMTLVTSPDATSIRHGIVRSFGYYVASILADDPGFGALKVALTKAFVSDLASSSILSLETQEAQLGEGIEKIVRKNLKAKKTNVLEGAHTSDAAIARFMVFVVGEAFDSYYCRTGAHTSFDNKIAARIKVHKEIALLAQLTDTRKRMAQFFPRTHTVFKGVELYLRGLAQGIPAKRATRAKGKKSPKDELALIETLAERRAALESQIAMNSRAAGEAYNTYADAKNSWFTRQTTVDTYKSVYNFHVNREQAMQKELRRLEEEERQKGAESKVGDDAQTFGKVDTSVATLDVGKELKTGMQEAAKDYGDAASRGLGSAGKFIDVNVFNDNTGNGYGQAIGEGVGRGAGNVMNGVGMAAFDTVSGAVNAGKSTVDFAHQTIVDPSKSGQQILDGATTAVTSSIDAVSGTAQDLHTGITQGDWDPALGRARAVGEYAADKAAALPGAGTVIGTYNYLNATNDEDRRRFADEVGMEGGKSLFNAASSITQKGMSEVVGGVPKLERALGAADKAHSALGTAQNLAELGEKNAGSFSNALDAAQQLVAPPGTSALQPGTSDAEKDAFADVVTPPPPPESLVPGDDAGGGAQAQNYDVDPGTPEDPVVPPGTETESSGGLPSEPNTSESPSESEPSEGAPTHEPPEPSPSDANLSDPSPAEPQSPEPEPEPEPEDPYVPDPETET